MNRIIYICLLAAFCITTARGEGPKAEDAWKKIISPSLTDQEKSKLFWSLPEETRKKVNAMSMEELEIRKKKSKKELEKRIALLNKGTSPLLGIVSSYERRIKAVNKGMMKDARSLKIQARFQKKRDILNRLIVTNTPENNIALWKIYKPIMTKVTATSKYSETTPGQLAAMEANIIDPLIAALEKDIAALPPSASVHISQ